MCGNRVGVGRHGVGRRTFSVQELSLKALPIWDSLMGKLGNLDAGKSRTPPP